MAVVDRFRAAADRGRKAVDALGLRHTTVALVVETWSAAVGTAGATLSSTTTTTLSPTPKVTITNWLPSAFGGGVPSGAAGKAFAAEVRIGPITPPYPAGGYDPGTQLAPAISSPAQRVYAVLTGIGFSTTGDRFEVTRIEADASLHSFIFAERTKQ